MFLDSTIVARYMLDDCMVDQYPEVLQALVAYCWRVANTRGLTWFGSCWVDCVFFLVGWLFPGPGF